MNKAHTIIVCDSSPLIALSRCDLLHILPELFNRVFIPEAVYAEIIVPGKPEADKLFQWAQGKIAKAGIVNSARAEVFALDPGEKAAIALYWEKSADFLFIDEQKGRAVAAQNNIRTMGIIGVLLRAKECGIISAIKPYLNLLIRHSYYLADSLYQKALKTAQEN